MTFIEAGTSQDLTRRARLLLADRFDRAAEVVGTAPGRVNLMGDHTDYNGGTCLPVALPHATYAAAAGRPDGVVRLASRQVDDIWTGTLSSTGPGQVTGWAAYLAGVVWALGEHGIDLPGVDIAVDSTVPLRAGLSSSASVECAVAVALCAIAGVDLDDGLRRDVAAACMRAEVEVAGAPTGGMDQTVAMLAQPGAALLLDFGEETVRQVPLALGGHSLLVTDTGITHELVDGRYGARRAECTGAAEQGGWATLREASLDGLGRVSDPVGRRRARHVVTEIARVTRSVSAINDADWTGLGGLMLDSHASLRDDFEVSCRELDTTVEAAVDAGAVGARMTGGGFGGSTVALVPRGQERRVADAVDHAFAAAGWHQPRHLVATPSGRAGLVAPR